MLEGGGSGVDGGESSNTARGGAEGVGGVGFGTTDDRGAAVVGGVGLIEAGDGVGGALVAGGRFR